MKNQGTVVQCENLRGGRRAIKLDGTTPLKCKTTSRDRKDILKASPIHVDSQSGLDFNLKFGQDEYDKLNKEVEENDILQKLRDLMLILMMNIIIIIIMMMMMMMMMMMRILIYLNWMAFFCIFYI